MNKDTPYAGKILVVNTAWGASAVISVDPTLKRVDVVANTIAAPILQEVLSIVYTRNAQISREDTGLCASVNYALTEMHDADSVVNTLTYALTQPKISLRDVLSNVRGMVMSGLNMGSFTIQTTYVKTSPAN